MRINKHDTNGAKPLLGKGELGYDDYTTGGDTGRVYVGTSADNIALAKRLEANMMTKAQFNALAEERKANRAGSGFDAMISTYQSDSTIINNTGMITAKYPAPLLMGTNVNRFAIMDSTISINGTTSRVYNHPTVYTNINHGFTSYYSTGVRGTVIELPTAPTIYPYDTVLTTEQIASGVIKHSDASNSGLIVNGKFDTDTSGWTALNSSLVVESNKLKITNTAESNGIARQSFSTTIGKEYIVEFESTSGSHNLGMQIKGDASGITGWSVAGATTGRYTFKYTATTTTTYLLFAVYNNSVGANAYVDNIAVYPADAISRSDLVFLESFHEDISEKNFVYPLGNVQYLGANTDGLTGIINGNFTGFETYSLFGNWQTSSALIGKGYVWSSLTEVQKKAFIANPDNNCYLDGDKTIQVRYRMRVVQGWGDIWSNTNPLISATSLYALKFSDDVNVGYVQPKGKLVTINNDLSSRNNGAYFPNGYLYSINDIGSWTALVNTTTLSTNLAYEGKCFAIPIALVHRRNQGMYHPVYNPNGSKKASDNNFWYNTAISFTSISDCFDPTKLLAASGYIGSVSGRPDGLFYDQVHEGDITDLRNSSKKVEDYNRLISREFNKLVAGTNRGKEGSMELKNYITSTINTKAQYTYAFGSCTYVKLNNVPPSGFLQEVYLDDSFTIFIKGNTKWYRAVSASTVNNNIILHPMYGNVTADFTIANSVDVLFIKKSTRTKSNTLLHCDIIGNPTNYPASWKESGVFGTPLILAEDGTSLLPDGAKDSFKLSRKANATPLLCLRSTDNGATWTSFTPTFSIPTNAITLTDEPAGNLVVVYYQTHTSMAVPVTNSEVLEIGDVFATTHYVGTYGGYLSNTLISKSPTSSGATRRFNYYKLNNCPMQPIPIRVIMTGTGVEPPSHIDANLLYIDNTPAIKVFPYLTRLNGKAYLNLVFKEMKHNGTSWGDDSKFNIVDNISTTTDNNAQTVLIGQKTVELPYFIGADE